MAAVPLNGVSHASKSQAEATLDGDEYFDCGYSASQLFSGSSGYTYDDLIMLPGAFPGVSAWNFSQARIFGFF